MNKYSTEEKQQAIDLYFKNGCNMKKTVRELGYGSATGILRWLRETVPDKTTLVPVPGKKQAKERSRRQ